MRRFLLALLLLAAPLGAADSMGRGYTSRPCGFDWDMDGTVGEANGDCDVICRDTAGTGPQTSDLDSDGDSEEEYYVDCDGGSDSDTGGPDDPFLTITFALSQADGVLDSAEDIICFTGTCPNTDVNLVPPNGDEAQSYWTKTAEGNQVRDFRYPQDPGGIFGWDTDADGEYPPYDTDDTSIIDGTGLIDTFHNFDFSNDYFQVGHFSVDNFAYHAGRGTDTKIFSGSSPEYFRVHDIEIDSWNEGGCADGDTRMINNGMSAVYGAYENVDFNDVQGKFMRGAAASWGGEPSIKYGGPARGPIRLQNLSVTIKGMWNKAQDDYCQTDSDNAVNLGRSWGKGTGYEIIDNRFDANMDNWFSEEIVSHTGHTMSQCMQDWDVINNYYKDFSRILTIDAGTDGSCVIAQGGRVTKDANVERNEWVNTYPRIVSSLVSPVYVGNPDCSDGNVFDGSLRVVNNMITTHSGGYIKYGMFLTYGSTTDSSTTTGETLIANNTFNIDNKASPKSPIIVVTQTDCATPFDHPIRMYNNIINGLEPGERAVSISGWDGLLSADYNVYENVDAWYWYGAKKTTLADWRTATGDEANSDTCAPTFVASTDFHLDSSDTCAQNNAISLAGDFTNDIDDETRSGWDIGADEQGVGYTPPSGACCTGASCALTTEPNCIGGLWQGADTVCSPNPCSVEDPPAAGFADGVSLSGVKKQ